MPQTRGWFRKTDGWAFLVESQEYMWGDWEYNHVTPKNFWETDEQAEHEGILFLLGLQATFDERDALEVERARLVIEREGRVID